MKMRKLVILVLFIAAVGCSHVTDPAASTRSRGYGPGEQEYGHITIRNGAHVFFWFYYAQTDEDPLTKPTVVFLSGGPGVSSTGVANFGQVGPQYVNGTERAASWAKYVNVLYIDQPVGTGFSTVYNDTVFQTGNIPNGGDLAQFMISFFNFYPKIHNTPFYFYSEGFGGKNMVELSYQLDVAIREQRIAMTFKGIILAGPWISPSDIFNSWAPFLLDKGLVDQTGYNSVVAATAKVQTAVDNKAWDEATGLWLDLLDVIDQTTDGVDILNINKKATKRGTRNKLTGKMDYLAYATIPEDEEIEKLMNGEVRRVLDVWPEATYNALRDGVFNALRADFLFPVINVISDLLRDSPLEITLLTGGLDLLSATPGTVKWVDGMVWPGSDQWLLAPKTPFLVNNVTVGTVKHYGNLTMYWIDQAGHMIPRDQPEVGLELLRLFSHYDD